MITELAVSLVTSVAGNAISNRMKELNEIFKKYADQEKRKHMTLDELKRLKEQIAVVKDRLTENMKVIRDMEVLQDYERRTGNGEPRQLVNGFTVEFNRIINKTEREAFFDADNREMILEEFYNDSDIPTFTSLNFNGKDIDIVLEEPASKPRAYLIVLMIEVYLRLCMVGHDSGEDEELEIEKVQYDECSLEEDDDEE